MSDRLNASVGGSVALNAAFANNGVPTDPYTIRAVRIYKQSVREENKVLEILVPPPGSTDYQSVFDSLFQRVQDPTVSETGVCGTDIGPHYLPGAYVLNLNLPCDTFEAGVYFDVWCFVGDLNCYTDQSVINWDDESMWTCQCNKFFLSSANNWQMDDDLTNIRLGFDPLDSKFIQPEKRMLEVGMMPLPLYDYDYKKLAPLIPALRGKITIETQNCETIVNDADMKIGLRSGSYRSNPYVLKYLLDTSKFFKGTYKYRVSVGLPNGETRVSDNFYFTVR
jgi:hypothetical protein